MKQPTYILWALVLVSVILGGLSTLFILAVPSSTTGIAIGVSTAVSFWTGYFLRG
jgi:hypothetical protein